jgi:hypothetical protein
MAPAKGVGHCHRVGIFHRFGVLRRDAVSRTCARHTSLQEHRVKLQGRSLALVGLGLHSPLESLLCSNAHRRRRNVRTYRPSRVHIPAAQWGRATSRPLTSLLKFTAVEPLPPVARPHLQRRATAAPKRVQPTQAADKDTDAQQQGATAFPEEKARAPAVSSHRVQERSSDERRRVVTRRATKHAEPQPEPRRRFVRCGGGGALKLVTVPES